jgi:hypothetical protein
VHRWYEWRQSGVVQAKVVPAYLPLYLADEILISNMNEYVYQLALFMGRGVIRADELSYDVRRRLDIGDFEPMLIPEAPGMPDDFPRLQINSPRGYRLTMSRARVDFFLDLPLGIDADDKAEFFSKCRELLAILDEREIRYSRVGLIKTSFAPGVGAPEFLVSSLTRLPTAGVSDASLSITKKITCSGVRCNSLFNFSNGVLASGQLGLLAIRDVNTDPALNADLALEATSHFIAEADAQSGIESILEFVGDGDV